MKRLYIIMVAAMALSSCIKEDRTHCPCYLHVDLTQVDPHYVHKMDLMLKADGGPAEWYPVRESAIGDTLIMSIDKSEFDFSAWGNLYGSVRDDDRMTIKPGEKPDSLWSYSNRINARCEDAYVKVIPDRQYIPVTIIVRGMLQNITDIRPVLENISGSLLYDGMATGGTGTLVPVPTETGSGEAPYHMYQTMIMTQTSATAAQLRLSFVRDDIRIDNTYPVGEMLSDMGEDISLVNQNPIILDLTIGTASVLLVIRVSDWTRHGIFTITY